MIQAGFEPGIFFLLLWGLFSWLTRKKKKKTSTDSDNVTTEPKSTEDFFTRLQTLQEHFSKEGEIFPSVQEPVKVEEEYFSEDNLYDFKEPEIPATKPEEVHEEQDYDFETDIKVQDIEYDNWLKRNLSNKSELRKLMVLREVMGEPRSLKPYTGTYFKS